MIKEAQKKMKLARELDSDRRKAIAAARRLANMAGTDPKAEAPPRRKM